MEIISHTKPKIRPYQRCARCVMDTTDSLITFDREGVCDHCRNFDQIIKPSWTGNEENLDQLLACAKEIKKANRHEKYDCIIGLSGGVDSSYLCYVVKKLMGLNPLCVIVDTGWNLAVANTNIQKIVTALEIDSVTEVIDWEEMKDLQLAFFQSQVPYQDLPQDHAIFATLYKFAVKNNIKYVMSGANNATEGIRPPVEWVYQNDLTLIKDISKKYGKVKLSKFPTCGLLTYRFYYPIFKGMKRVYPLNMVHYDKEKVREFLIKNYDWEAYANKHYENIFTRWYEGYYLPNKFGYDKRKTYLSNEILTGITTREAALKELDQPGYSPTDMKADMEFIAKKLGLSINEFQSIIQGENKSFKDYRNSWWLIQFGTIILRLLGKEKKKFR